MSEYEWQEHEWSTRTGIIASLIVPHSRVLDMGGGKEHLKRYIEKLRSYRSVDKTRCTKDTIVADLNKGEYPDIPEQFDVVVAQGLIEYLDDPAAFLKEAQRYAPVLIVTYLDIPSAEAIEKGRVTTFSMREFRRLLAASGWHLKKRIAYTDNHCIFVCRLPVLH